MGSPLEIFKFFGRIWAWFVARAENSVARVKQWDWRAWSIGTATMIAILITVVAPVYWPNLLDIATFQGGFFASWAAGVALFALVGLVVAVASLSQPDRESFDARARNFLRRQSGGHIDYMVDKLRVTVEPYVVHSRKRLIVEEWRPVEGKFRVRHETTSVVRGFLDDHAIKFPAKLNYISYCDPPPGGKKACVSFIRVNDEDKHGFAEFDREFMFDFQCEAAKNSSCKVEHVMTYWVEAEKEVNRHKTIRYTRELEVEVKNGDSQHSIVVSIREGAQKQEILLKPAEEKRIIHLFERQPDQYVYDFRILPA